MSFAAVTIVVGACNSISGTSDFSIGGGKDGIDPNQPGRGPDDGQTQQDLPSGSENVDAAVSSTTDAVSVVAPNGLDFGDVSCGNSPAPRAVEVHNLGTNEITYDAALGTTLFTVSPAKGTIAGGGVSLLTVSTPGAPSNGPVGAQADTLTVTTNAAGDSPHALGVKLAVVGAIFKLSPDSLNYGQMTNTPITKSVTISNEGNVAGTVSFSLTQNEVSSYSIKTASPVTIAPGSAVVVSITAAPPKSGPTEKSGRVGLSSSTSLCGPLPSGVALTCRRPD